MPELTGPLKSNMPAVVFAGHNKYMLSVVKVCRESGQFTDVNIQCSDGQVLAHKLVLASASKSLRDVLSEMSEDEPATIVLSDFSQSIVLNVIDFIYSGKMVLSASNANQLHSLVIALGIDPNNVRLDTVDTPINVVRINLTGKNNQETEGLLQPGQGEDERQRRRCSIKRRQSTDSQNSGKRVKGDSDVKPVQNSEKSSHQKKSSRAKGRRSSLDVPSGYHDMTRKDTWVCAICECYDPPEEESAPPTTEWIGCDCNRWYHKHCTKLKEFDESFSCKDVKVKCLPE